MAFIVPGRKFSSTMSAVFTSVGEDLLAARTAHVEADALLAAVVHGEIDALPAHHRRMLARLLAAESFDLDHLGAEIGQDHPAARTRLIARQFQHADAVETEIYRSSPPSIGITTPDT